MSGHGGGHGHGEPGVRHLVSTMAIIVAIFCYVGGYLSGTLGWWWTGFSLLIVYGGIYKIIDA